MPEASLEHTDHGVFPSGEGCFVVNARDAQWFESDGLGFFAPFEGENARFQELGINLNILRPGEPACMYHGEEAQECFLVLAGECLLIVEGQERLLGPWDFFHCPPWTEHVLVGAGEGPCLTSPSARVARGEGFATPLTRSRFGTVPASRRRPRTRRKPTPASRTTSRSHARASFPVPEAGAQPAVASEVAVRGLRAIGELAIAA